MQSSLRCVSVYGDFRCRLSINSFLLSPIFERSRPEVAGVSAFQVVLFVVQLIIIQSKFYFIRLILYYIQSNACVRYFYCVNKRSAVVRSRML